MNKKIRGLLVAACMSALSTVLAAEIPHLVRKDGHHALMVDGKPFIMLGVQAHNSSNYPGALPQVWAAVRDAHANTLEIPVAWEQVEPAEGKFDFSYVDQLVAQAREQKVRLVLLWFATWKNTRPQYAPEWVKSNPARFPRIQQRDGKWSYCVSPLGEHTLNADKRAFVELMTHLKKIDGDRHTVIMVQVQNEAGTTDSVRDFAPKAEQAFRQPVPPAVLARQKSLVAGAASGSWSEVYGPYADEYFHAYSIASYIEEIAKAGRAAYDLPMYVNNALRDPLEPMAPWRNNWWVGGPTFDVIDIYKAAAPHIDFAAPDIYMGESAKYSATLERFQRPDNALMVPEMGNAAGYARFIYQVLGRGGIGVAPFGVDYFAYTNYPLGAKHTDQTMAAPFGKIYAAFRPLTQLWAGWALEGRTAGIAESDARTPQTLSFKEWDITVSYRQWQLGEQPESKDMKDIPPGTESPSGGVAVAQIGPQEFVLIGQHARLRIKPKGERAGQPWNYARVEEGTFDTDGKWLMVRNWNGDQVDAGLNLTGNPTILRVKMGAY